MEIADIDTSQMEFSTEELDAMVEILTKAEEIKSDPPLYALVQRQMKKKVKSIKSVSDLRAKQVELETTPEPTKGA